MDFDMFSGALFPGYIPVQEQTNLQFQVRTATASRHPPRRLPLIVFVMAFGVISLICETLRTYIISQALTLEQHFNTQLIVFEDIGYLVAILFFGIYGRTGISNIPRFIGTSIVIYGSSGAMFGVFYLFLPVIGDNVGHDTTVHKARLCLLEQKNDEMFYQDGRLAGTGSSVWVAVFFALMMMVQGAAQPVRFILGSPFIEHNEASRTKATLYSGILLLVNFFWRPVAYVSAAVYSNTSLDNTVASKCLADPSWLGAWWIGSLTAVSAAPLCIYTWGKNPPPGQPCGVRGSRARVTLREKLIDLPRCVYLLLNNCVFVILLVGISCVAMFLGGSADHEARYMEAQFGLPTRPAYLITALKLLVVLLVGTIGGAVIMALLKLNNKGCLKFATVAMATATITFSLQLKLGCENPDVIGLGEQRIGSPSGDCVCDVTEYFPLCGEDVRSYVSPCYAGCTNHTDTAYSGCMGIPGGEGVAGLCPRECSYLWYYVGANVMSGMCAVAASAAVVLTITRCVAPTRRTMALSLTGFSCCLVAWLSSATMYHSVIASTCKIRDQSCDHPGACALYDLPSLRSSEKRLDLCLQACALLMFIIAYLLQGSKQVDQPEKDDWDEDQEVEPVDL
ncbi:solute carrier organic anion transporter family member 4C1-like [Haliotis cracherodii]|uniref:solute carrier organic anion transporter family member 4C1-like n=1 Tax=Haliotis cracherodii TaxID=6455 RepID=UPI0039EA743F